MNIEDIKLGSVFRIPPIDEWHEEDIEVYFVLHYERVGNKCYPTVDVIGCDGKIYSGFVITQHKAESWINIT